MQQTNVTKGKYHVDMKEPHEIERRKMADCRICENEIFCKTRNTLVLALDSIKPQ